MGYIQFRLFSLTSNSSNLKSLLVKFFLENFPSITNNIKLEGPVTLLRFFHPLPLPALTPNALAFNIVGHRDLIRISL
jgi:hypothetical protein